MVLLIISVFLSGLLYSDANVWRFLQESELEINPIEVTDEGPIHHDPRCIEGIKTCFERLPQPLSPAWHDGVLTFYDCHIDSVCSASEQLVSCIKDQMPDPEMCYDESVIVERISELYNFVCVANRSDLYNLLDCANNKRVQQDIYRYISIISLGFLMLNKLERADIVIPDDVKNSVRCWLFEGFRLRVSSSVYPCGEEAGATVRRLIPFVVSLLDLFVERDFSSFDFSTCPNRM